MFINYRGFRGNTENSVDTVVLRENTSILRNVLELQTSNATQNPKDKTTCATNIYENTSETSPWNTMLQRAIEHRRCVLAVVSHSLHVRILVSSHGMGNFHVVCRERSQSMAGMEGRSQLRRLLTSDPGKYWVWSQECQLSSRDGF